MSHAATLLLAACPLLTALAACGAAPSRETTIASRAPTAESLSVRGFLGYVGGVALPHDGFAIVELRDTEPPRAVVAKYEAVDDPTTTLWNKGRRARLTIRGKAYPECVWVSSQE